MAMRKGMGERLVMGCVRRRRKKGQTKVGAVSIERATAQAESKLNRLQRILALAQPY